MENLKVSELKEMAKELKIKNWWTLKKEDLIEAINWKNGIITKHTVEGTELIEPDPRKEIKELPKHELKEKAKEADIPHANLLNKAALVQELTKITEGELTTLKDLIIEAGIKGTKARRILRNANIERPYKRWEWHTEEHAHIIQQVRDLLK